MMKKTLIIALVLLVSVTSIFAGISGAPLKTYGLPLLITNAGQGPGGKSARLLATRANTIVLDEDFFYKSEPQEADLTDRPYSCLMVVIGSTDKGLGASGITIDDEIARLEKMVGWAKKYNIPMVGVLLEKDKRASGIPTNANERCIDTIMPYCEWMIVVKDGNKDKRFDQISAQYNIPLTIIDSSLDFTNLIKQVFPK
ncbi:MAG: hypothetical protein HUK24_01270 [Sphaerochaetaceae bacterium]|nr:hypothetical protein [Sphaerochaetaceae bacterium]